MEMYLDALSQSDKNEVKFVQSDKSIVFGDGIRKRALKRTVIHIRLGRKLGLPSVDVAEASIPLLLSVETMEKCKANIVISTMVARVMDEKIPIRRINRLLTISISTFSEECVLKCIGTIESVNRDQILN